MALSQSFLDELRARVTLSTLVGRRVSWDPRKSNPAKGDHWACCPFHDEKSPSFHVDDRKGFYHCFGCGASGDAVTFLREAEGMSFIEAVTELAGLAGMSMPAQDPDAARKAEAAKGLAEWMEAALRFYREGLRGARGEAARRYLAGRRLSEAAVEKFELGVAPASRRALYEHLRGKGAGDAVLAEAGLIGLPEGGGEPYDRFRDRLIFPIRDGRGRCIAFGGRILGEGGPKYLNSPETPLFSKSRTLYNLQRARAAAAKSGALVLAEGYMDVIALHEGGFEHAVAPLGTAVTAEQLDMAWRMADEPVAAMDGDAAGQKAALRLADLALPLLKAGKSLRFAMMPPGRDPDDVLRSEGRAALATLLEGADPMIRLLWRRETEGRDFDSPERRAGLDARLRRIAFQIADERLRKHYEDAFREMRFQLFRPAARPKRAAHQGRREGRGGRFAPPEGPSAALRASALARGDGGGQGREAALVMALWLRPDLAESHGEDIAHLEFSHPRLDLLAQALVAAACDGAAPEVIRASVRARLGFDPEPLLSALLPLGGLGRNAAPETLALSLTETLARMRAEAALAREAAEFAAEPAPGAEADRRLAGAAAFSLREGRGTLQEAEEDDSSINVQKYLDGIDSRRKR